jgi:hypothetical protein
LTRRKKNRELVPATPPKFTSGTPVRVKAGVPDPDYPDIPLGGWAGVVREIDTDSRPPLYEVEWTPATLERIHPIYKRRCERDGLEGDSTWLREGDLEPDPGGEPVLEQPTQLVARPLDRQNPYEIALGVFGLTSDDELPPVNEENLRRFHEHLSGRLHFPIIALRIGNAFDRLPLDMMNVRRLLPFDPSEGTGLQVEVFRDEEPETVPLALVLPPSGGSNEREIEAYRLWFAEQGENFERAHTPGPSWLLLSVLTAMALGMLIGAVLEAVPGAVLAAQIGGGLLALVGALVGGMLEMGYRKSNGYSDGVLGGLILGALWGAGIGAGLGAAVLVAAGAIGGAVAGTILAAVLRAVGLDWGVFKLTFAGAALGAAGWAFLLDASKAGTGATLGAFAGAGAALLSRLAMHLYARIFFR